MSIKDDEKIMKEKCVCENCKSPIILKHFEKCERCSSEAYHSTPRKLNPELWEKQEDDRKNNETCKRH